MALNRHQQHIEDKMMAPQYLKIINDCARLVNETKNPDVYFSRYDLLMEKAIALNSIKTIKFDGDSPAKIVEQVWNKKDQNCYEFIERYAQSVKHKIWNLKTEKGKLAQAENFHDSMLKYYDKMSERNINECERQYYLLLGEASSEYYEKIQEMNLDNTTYSEEREIYMPNTNISNETNNEVQVNKPIFCPQCGTANNIGVHFCMKCGYNFETGEKGTVNAPKQKNVILMRLLLAICIVFLVFVSMFSALLFIMGIVESIPSMAVCGFIFLAGSVVGTVFSAKGLSKYKITPKTNRVQNVYNGSNVTVTPTVNIAPVVNQPTNNKAKILVMRKSQMNGSILSHDVYLYNTYIGELKSGKMLEIPVEVGTHMLVFKSKFKNGKDTTFTAVVNEPTEVVRLNAEFNFNGEFIISYADNAPHFSNAHLQSNVNTQMPITNATMPMGTTPGIRCTRCGSANLFPVSETTTKGKDFNAGDALCGALLLGPLGLLCGATGKGKQTTTTTYWLCKDCGNKFKA